MVDKYKCDDDDDDLEVDDFLLAIHLLLVCCWCCFCCSICEYGISSLGSLITLYCDEIDDDVSVASCLLVVIVVACALSKWHS